MKSKTLRTAGPQAGEFDPRARRVSRDGTIEYIRLPERKPIPADGLRRELDMNMKTQPKKLDNEAIILRLHERYAAGELIKDLAAEANVSGATLRTYFQARGLAYPIRTKQAEPKPNPKPEPKPEPEPEPKPQTATQPEQKLTGTGSLILSTEQVVEPKFDLLRHVARIEKMVSELNRIEHCSASFTFKCVVRVSSNAAADS